MARAGWGKHTTQVNTSIYPDDDSYPIGSDEWNEPFHKGAGIFGFDAQTVVGHASNVVPNRSVVVLSGNVETGVLGLADSEQYDVIWVFTSGSVVLTNRQTTPNADGQIVGLDTAATTITLSTTIPKIFIRRTVGSVDAWFEYGGGTVGDSSVTFQKIQDLATMKVIGRTAGGSGVSSEVAILDEDNMSTDSATSLATQQSIKAYIATQVSTGDITSVVAGAGLTGGATSGAATLNVVGGTGITANADEITVDNTVAILTGAQTFADKTLTSPILNTGVSGTAVLDEDNFASDSATKLATQQSIKAYIATQVSTGDITSVVAGAGLTGGATSGAATVNVAGGTGITANADDIAIDATVATLLGTQTLENKTVDLGDNTVTGTIGEFNTALQSESFATLGGTETLVSKTLTAPVLNTATSSGLTMTSATSHINMAGADLQNGGVIFLKEQASAESSIAGSGQIWVDLATPNKLFFTDDAGTDVDLTAGGGSTASHDFVKQAYDFVPTNYTGESPTTTRYLHVRPLKLANGNQDTNNEGVFIRIQKNGTHNTEVQIA